MLLRGRLHPGSSSVFLYHFSLSRGRFFCVALYPILLGWFSYGPIFSLFSIWNNIMAGIGCVFIFVFFTVRLRTTGLGPRETHSELLIWNNCCKLEPGGGRWDEQFSKMHRLLEAKSEWPFSGFSPTASPQVLAAWLWDRNIQDGPECLESLSMLSINYLLEWVNTPYPLARSDSFFLFLVIVNKVQCVPYWFTITQSPLQKLI